MKTRRIKAKEIFVIERKGLKPSIVIHLPKAGFKDFKKLGIMKKHLALEEKDSVWVNTSTGGVTIVADW